MVSADVIEMSCVSVLNCLELLSSGHCISRRLVNKWSFSHTCECGVKNSSVLIQAPDEAALSTLAETLTQAGVAHKLWIEQPENIPTCLALKPCAKETVQPLLRKFKLFK